MFAFSHFLKLRVTQLHGSTCFSQHTTVTLQRRRGLPSPCSPNPSEGANVRDASLELMGAVAVFFPFDHQNGQHCSFMLAESQRVSSASQSAEAQECMPCSSRRAFVPACPACAKARVEAGDFIVRERDYATNMYIVVRPDEVVFFLSTQSVARGSAEVKCGDTTVMRFKAGVSTLLRERRPLFVCVFCA